MKKPLFYHPDIDFTVIRRRSADLLLDLLYSYGSLLDVRAKALLWQNALPSQTAHKSALYRLRKEGVIVRPGAVDRAPELVLTADGTKERERLLSPDRFWKKKWRGIWSVLMYDVAEQDRKLRDSLRRFLQRLRMGQLQKSVYVSPWNIRPEYADLTEAIHVEIVSFLFEATTVLGRSRHDVARYAWDFGRIDDGYAWYLACCEKSATRIKETSLARADLEILAGEEMTAFTTVVQADPLLPRELHPPGFLGPETLLAHRNITALIKQRIEQAP